MTRLYVWWVFTACHHRIIKLEVAILEVLEVLEKVNQAYALKQIPNVERKEMVNYCRVFGCTNRSDRDKHLEFYRLPKNHKSGRRMPQIIRGKEALVVSEAKPGSARQTCGQHPNLFGPFLVR